MKRPLSKMLLISGTLSSLAGECWFAGGPTPPPCEVATLRLEPPNATVGVNENLTVTAIIGVNRPSPTCPLENQLMVDFQSTDASIASIAATGDGTHAVVTGNRAGTTTVRVLPVGHSNAAASSTTITVTAAPTIQSVRLTSPATTVLVDATLQIIADALDASGNVVVPASFTWTTSDPTIATVSTVDEYIGVVRGVKAGGPVTIGVISQGKSASIQITVLQPIATVQVTPATPHLTVNQDLQLTATLLDASGASISPVGRHINWSSSATTIAQVALSGVVTGKALGTATITAEVEGKSGTALATVETVVQDRVELLPTSTSVAVGASVPLSATYYDAQGVSHGNRNFNWSSSNNAIATVSNAGVVSGVAASPPGNPVIITVTDIASTRSATALVTVTGPPPTAASVAVSPSPLVLRVDETHPLAATIRDVQGNILAGYPVTWQSSNPTIVSVTTGGTITAVAPGGPVTISATAGSAHGNALVTVITARMAYALVDPISGGALVNSATSFNSSGGSINVTKTGNGAFTVSFAGLRALPGDHETVLVTRYGDPSSNNFCKLDHWESGSSNTLLAYVRCFAFQGFAIDAAFTITVLGSQALGGRMAFALADQEFDVAPYTPSNSYNGNDGGALAPLQITRTAQGEYEVAFAGNAGNALDAEAIMVTAVGPGTERCNIAVPMGQSDIASNAVRIHCWASMPDSKALVDSKFAVALVEGGRGGQLAGVAYAGNALFDEYENTGIYPLLAERASSASGSSVDLERLAIGGVFKVIFHNFVPPSPSARFSVQVVNKDGDSSNYCHVVSWGTVGSDFSVTVKCWSESGGAEDESFYLMLIR